MFSVQSGLGTLKQPVAWLCDIKCDEKPYEMSPALPGGVNECRAQCVMVTI